MKTDVEKARDALIEARKHATTNHVNYLPVRQLSKIRDNLCLDMDTMKRAIWWVTLEERIDRARNEEEFKSVLQEILREVAR